MYRALEVAQYIIRRCNQQKKSISNLKLQKILYFVQAEFLVTTGNRCFSDEIEAWDFGPVVPEVYHHYKAYGSANIPVFRMNSDLDAEISKSDQIIMNGIIDECSKYSASALVQLTHNQAPWKNHYKRGCNNEIPFTEIKAYFDEDKYGN